MNRRIACALIPDFPLVVQLREHPELFEKPVVLVESESNRAKVLSINIQAVDEGVTLGMTLVQAKNVYPQLFVLVRDEKKEKYKFDELLRKFQNFSPFIEEVKPGIAYLDASGLTRIYPQEKDFAEKLMSFIRNQNYPVKIGMAGKKFTSLIGAAVSEIYSYTVVPEGEERKFLESKPIQLLPIDQELYEKFYQLGIKTIGQFALLPSQDVTERFGSEGLRLLKLAKGEDDEPLLPKTFDEKQSENLDLSSPLKTQMGIIFYVNSILQEQFRNLTSKGLACGEILIFLTTEDNNKIPITISVAQETNLPKTFLNLLRLELEKIILSSPVKEVKVTIQRTTPLLSEQLSLYQKKEINPFIQILGQLKRILGNGNIYFPQTLSSHKPEGKFRLAQYLLKEEQTSVENRKTRKSDKKLLVTLPESGFNFCQDSISGLRLYNPPKPATIRRENGVIKFVIAESWYGEVVKQKGPWEVSGQWWYEDFDRYYFEIELAGGEEYLIFFDNSSKKWFLQGIFD
jgi:protein ImuB